jgi:hypothetical protein
VRRFRTVSPDLTEFASHGLWGTSLSKPPGEHFELGAIRETTILMQASVNNTTLSSLPLDPLASWNFAEMMRSYMVGFRPCPRVHTSFAVGPGP